MTFTDLEVPILWAADPSCASNRSHEKQAQTPGHFTIMASDDHTTAFTGPPPGGAVDQRGNQATTDCLLSSWTPKPGIFGPLF
jgi:hypothetical protein